MVASSGGAALTAGTLVADRYRLIKQLGEGAMGVVWSALNSATNGGVALKLILRSEPELRQRLLREARACGTIRHRNVVQVHDVGQTTGGDPFLVMELLQGETLAELLVRKRRLSPPEAASIGRDIARALAAAHAKGIVHRDLKPANIFLHHEEGGDAPIVKVLDFGVSKNFLHSDGLRTVAGGAVGSPMYMSPEQARAERDIDGRADLWSLGVLLYEMLTGERPFIGETAEVLVRITSGAIPQVSRRVRRIDPDFDAIVAGCLTRDRAARLGPALEVARRLEAHAAPDARAPLPSLMDVGPVELAAGGSASDGAAFSPGPGPAALQWEDGGEEEATRRMDPAMLAPAMLPCGPIGVAPGRSAPPPDASSFEPVGAGICTVPMFDAHGVSWTPAADAQIKSTVRMSPAGILPEAAAPVQETAFSVFTEAPPIPPIASEAPRRPRRPGLKKPVVAIVGVVLPSMAAVLLALWLRRPAPPPPSADRVSTTGEATARPAAPPPLTAAPPPLPPAPSASQPTPGASVTAKEVPSTAVSSTVDSSAPPPRKPGPATTTKSTWRPTITTKSVPPPCTSKFGLCKSAKGPSANAPGKPASGRLVSPKGL